MISWFRSLRVSTKLALISFFFLIPDSILLTLFLLGINDHIHFAQSERHGNEYQRPLEQLLERLPSHRQLSREMAGRGPDTDALAGEQQAIDRAFSELAATDRRLGEALQFTNEGLAKRNRAHFRVTTLAAEWRALKASLTSLALDEREARHAHLLADVRTMITHAGDTSNLILDPDLDSYYLMDVTLLALPAMQERLAAVIAYTDALPQEGLLPRGAQNQLAVYAAVLRDADLDRVVSSANTALNEDENFYGRSESLQRNLPSALDEFEGAADEFIRLTGAMGQADRFADASARFRTAGNNARTASFRLWRAADKELDELLALRIRHYQGRRTRSLSLTAFAALAAVCFVTFITRSITGPLKKQAAALQDANLTLQAEMRERQRAEAALIDASRRAGMAEVATGVLHNVGNVLNSVNLGASNVRERLEASRLTHLRTAVDLMDQQRAHLPTFFTTDPRGQGLPDFLAKLTTHLEEENQELRAETDTLSEHIDHIKQIVSMQQSHARVFGVMELLLPSALIEEALRLQGESLTKHQIVIDREFSSTRTVMLDRHKVLQILVNLLSNAKQAIVESAGSARRITVRVRDTGPDRIVMSVSDTGSGVSADNMPKIFRLGFTTKATGHGFGLHSSALAARELNGELSAQSDGTNHGATFTLELPSIQIA